MNKSELLELMKKIHKLANDIEKEKSITAKEKQNTKKIKKELGDNILYISKYVEDTDREILDRRTKEATEQFKDLTNIRKAIIAREDAELKVQKEKEAEEKKKYDISKAELLSRIKKLQNLAIKTSKEENISVLDKHTLAKIKESIISDLVYVRDEVKDTDSAIIIKYAEKIDKETQKVKAIAEKIKNDKTKVKGKEKEDQKVTSTGTKPWVRATIIIGSCICIGGAIAKMKGCQKDEDPNTLNKPGTNGTTPPSSMDGSILDNNKPSTGDIDYVFPYANIYDVDINDEQVLYNYVNSLKSKYSALDNFTAGDIVRALKLANFEKLDDKAVFYDIDGLTKAMNTIANLNEIVKIDDFVVTNNNEDIFVTKEELKDVIKNVASNFDIKEFDKALTYKGYNIYSLFNICIDLVNESNIGAGKILNDLAARIFTSGTLLENCEINTRYNLAAIYANYGKKLIKLTSKEGSAIYGNGYVTDQNKGYGNICVEELVEYISPLDEKGKINKDNALYGYYAEELIFNQYNLSR